jgi:hypothetical protein
MSRRKAHLRDPKTGRFRRTKGGGKSVHASIATSGDLMEQLAQHADVPRLANKIANCAWRGDWPALELLIKATSHRPPPVQEYDFSRLDTPGLRTLQVLLKKAGNKPLSSSDVQHLEQIAAAAPNPYQLSSEDEHEPDAGGEESHTDLAEGRLQLDEFSLDAVNGSPSQRKWPARHRR